MSDERMAGSGSDFAPESARSSAVTREVVRYLTSSTGLIGSATSVALPVGIVSALITIHYLSPSKYGELALLMVFASFLTVMYNVGLLHGTFLWVYGSSGEAGDDLEIEGAGRSGVATQRSAMGTGLVLTLIIAGGGTAIFFIFKRPLAGLLLGNPGAANLIGWAAISGGAGSIYRLTCNVFRFERRRLGFAVATVARPLAVLGGSSALLIAGYGVWGALVGTAVPTIGCAIGCMLATRRSYALAFSLADARQIGLRGAAVVIPVLALFILHSGDIYVLSIWVHGAPLGVYRLASRLGSPPSYLASAFIISWSPLERSALGAAWYDAGGHLKLRSGILTYYFLIGVTIVVAFVLFSRVFVLVAPAGYADAAKVVPLIALAFVTYGAYIVVLRTARPERLILWYSITSALAAIVFIASAFVLVPALGVYGPALALTLGMSAGIALLLRRNAHSPEPLPVDYRSILAGFLVAGVVSGVALAGARAGELVAIVTTVMCLVAYLPSLVLVRAIPRSHLQVIRGILGRRRDVPGARLTPSELPAAERDALERFRHGALTGSRSAVDYARLTRGLRRIGGIGTATTADSRIGVYLASTEPESIRDFQVHELIDEGVDAFDLHHLDLLAKAARRGRLAGRHQPRQAHTRKALRTRALALGPQDQARLVEALLTAAADAKPRDQRTLDGRPSAVALVRSLRVIRDSLGVGAASASDLALARALWHDDGGELGELERVELRQLKAAAKLTSRLGTPAEVLADPDVAASGAERLDPPGQAGGLTPAAINSTIEETQASELVG